MKKIRIFNRKELKSEQGRIGMGILLWILGIPLPIILIIFFLMRGC